MTKVQKMSALERITTVLDGKIPDRVPSFILGGDCDFVYRFMNSPYKLTNEDIAHLEKDRVSFMIPFIHSIVAKFSPPDIFPSGLDAKIDMCWSTTGGGFIQLNFTDKVLTRDGGTFDAVVKEDGIPHFWYTGPALLKKEYIEESLGMKLEIINISNAKDMDHPQSTIYFRNNYLKSALFLAKLIKGDQRVIPIQDQLEKQGVDVEIYLGRDYIEGNINHRFGEFGQN